MMSCDHYYSRPSVKSRQGQGRKLTSQCHLKEENISVYHFTRMIHNAFNKAMVIIKKNLNIITLKIVSVVLFIHVIL